MLPPTIEIPTTQSQDPGVCFHHPRTAADGAALGWGRSGLDLAENVADHVHATGRRLATASRSTQIQQNQGLPKPGCLAVTERHVANAGRFFAG